MVPEPCLAQNGHFYWPSRSEAKSIRNALFQAELVDSVLSHGKLFRRDHRSQRWTIKIEWVLSIGLTDMINSACSLSPPLQASPLR